MRIMIVLAMTMPHIQTLPTTSLALSSSPQLTHAVLCTTLTSCMTSLCCRPHPPALPSPTSHRARRQDWICYSQRYPEVAERYGTKVRATLPHARASEKRPSFVDTLLPLHARTLRRRSPSAASSLRTAFGSGTS